MVGEPVYAESLRQVMVRRRRGWLLRCRRCQFGDLFLDVAECELQLIDRSAKLFRGGTILLTQHARETQLQLLMQQRQFL